MRIHTIFRFKLGIRRVRGKEWASDRVGRENMSRHENLIDLMRTALKIRVYLIFLLLWVDTISHVECIDTLRFRKRAEIKYMPISYHS